MKPLFRLHAVFAVRGMTLAQASRVLGCSRTHLRDCLTGGRQPSAALISRVEQLIGRADLAFIRGQAPSLTPHPSC